MNAIHTRDNASRLLQQASGVEINGNGTTSAYVAANVANELGIVLAGDMGERSDVLSSQSQLLSSDSAYMRKASAVTTDSVSHRDIQTYTVAEGESVNDVARKFGIKSETIRWANDLGDNEGISAGDKLTILPVDGVLHTIASGDTAEKLAEKYEANATQIVRFNDAEVAGFSSGQEVVIPGGVKPAPEPSFNPSTSNFANSFAPNYSVGNGYAYGYCTWYVANRIDVPNNWGNANTWAMYAAASGWSVGSTPTAGSIAQRGGGWGGLGHVGVVEEVSADGSEVLVSDMNGSAGWGRTATQWVPTSSYSSYISR